MNELTHDDGADEALLRELGLEQLGAELVKMEGRVFVRFSGWVEAGGLRVPYHLVPSHGVLAKPSKWRKLDREGKRKLLLERVTQESVDALNASVAAFVDDIVESCEHANLNAAIFLNQLAELETSEPASYVFERIEQRLDHAIERDQEERHAERTKQSINLAEYPDTFEVARRMPRKFIALLGPTNSGKTHIAHLTPSRKARLSFTTRC